MGPFTSYLRMMRLVSRAEAGDGLAAWQAFAELHRLCSELPGDHEYRQLLARVEPLIAKFASAIVQSALQPQAAGSRAALTELRQACGIAGQASARNVQRAREARERGERAAWSAVHLEVARAIVEGVEPSLASERSVYVEIAAAAARVDKRTAREYDLPPVGPAAQVARPRQQWTKHRVQAQKPKRWKDKL